MPIEPGTELRVQPEALLDMATALRGFAGDFYEGLALPALPAEKALGVPIVAAATEEFLTHLDTAAKRIRDDLSAMADHLGLAAAAYRENEAKIAREFKDGAKHQPWEIYPPAPPGRPNGANGGPNGAANPGPDRSPAPATPPADPHTPPPPGGGQPGGGHPGDGQPGAGHSPEPQRGPQPTPTPAPLPPHTPQYPAPTPAPPGPAPTPPPAPAPGAPTVGHEQSAAPAGAETPPFVPLTRPRRGKIIRLTDYPGLAGGQ